MSKLLPSAKQYERPENEAELYEILSQTDGSDYLIAGGTSLSFSRPAVQRIIDISKMPLKGCRFDADNNLVIGAMTTIGDLERNSAAATFCGGILRQTTDQLASTPLRNLITVGGNLAAGYAWCDLPVALLAMDAQYEVIPGENSRTIPYDGSTSFRRLSKKDEIISKISLGSQFKDASGVFMKFSRTSTDLAMVNVAVTMKVEQNILKTVRIVAGGLVPTPMRLQEIEQMLEGQVINSEFVEQAVKKLNLKPRPDTRASAEYRLEVLKTLISRACNAAGEQANEN